LPAKLGIAVRHDLGAQRASLGWRADLVSSDLLEFVSFSVRAPVESLGPLDETRLGVLVIAVVHGVHDCPKFERWLAVDRGTRLLPRSGCGG